MSAIVYQNFSELLLDPLLGAGTKGFPATHIPLRRSEIGRQGWNILKGDLPFPIAVVKQQQLQHNLHWMQMLAQQHQLHMAPHGKTTMSPQLFQAQLQQGAWGMTISTLPQLQIALHSGATNCLIANEIISEIDLKALAVLKQQHPTKRIIFLLDSVAQLEQIEHITPHAQFEVLLEVGVLGGRCGVRNIETAQVLAQRAFESTAVKLVGVECYEGLAVKTNDELDKTYVDALLERVLDLIKLCQSHHWFETETPIISAGGSAIYDLVLPYLQAQAQQGFLALLRSGCYITHDHGFYQRVAERVSHRLGCGTGLEAALEVWAMVQSLPEPNLAIVSMGKRDISYDIDLPTPIAYCAQGSTTLVPAPTVWKVSGMNDQHAYLRLNGESGDLKVGDKVVFGVSHPCTTFDKWRWMPIVDEQYQVVDALVTHF